MTNRPQPRPKLQATAIDAVVVAIAPALIIGMIACLIFFLVVAFYRGEYDIRLMYILGLYTLATVLIARIAIESGRAYANLFSIPLAVVSIFAMLRFVVVTGPLGPFNWVVNIALLGLAWYLADRITFDCTLVDERKIAPQQGLLQTLGLLKRDQALGSEKVLNYDGDRRVAVAAEGAKKKGAKKKASKHNPGVWVLYFALLAFPLFGLGQLAIPEGPQRNSAFYFLVGYLACALCLLVTTSFIGMRRYLRQKSVNMPADMIGRWLGSGAIGVMLILLACMILPLPGRSLGLVGLPFEITSPDNLSTSRFGWGNEGPQESEQADAASTTSSDRGPQRGPPSPEAEGNPTAADGANSQSSNSQSSNSQSSNSQSSNSQSSNSQSSNSQSSNSQSSNSQSSDSQSSDGQSSDGQSSDGQSSAKQSGDAASSNSMDRSPSQSSQDPSKSVEGQSAEGQGSRQPNSREPSGAGDTGRAEPGQPPNQESANRPQDASDATAPSAADAPESGNASGDPDSSASTSSTRTGSDSPLSGTISQMLSALPSSLAEIFKWLTIAVLVAIIVVYALTHPGEIAKLWREFLQFLGLLLGGKRTSPSIQEKSATAVSRVPAVVRKPFQAYENPFATQLAGWPPARVIEHTFAAFEAWAAEHGVERQHDQTATEFARRVGKQTPAVGTQATSAAHMLDQLMFAGWQPKTQDIQSLATFWQTLQAQK